MAITRVAFGARSYAGSPGAPAGPASGDYWVAMAGNIGGAALSMDAAWTPGPTAVSPGSMRISAFTFPYVSSTPILTITGASFCFITSYRPSAGMILSPDGGGSAVIDLSGIGNVGYATATPAQGGDMCVLGGFVNLPSSISGLGPVSGSDPAMPALAFDDFNGIDLEMSLSDGIRTAATATGLRSQLTNDTGITGGLVVLLKEITGISAVLSGTVFA